MQSLVAAPPGVSIPGGQPQQYRSRAEALAHARELQLRGFVELERCRRSVLYYLERYCLTIDEHNRAAPVQPLIHGDHVVDPATLQMVRELDGREDDFLRYLTLAWSVEPLLGVPKSRQMRVSHWAVAVHGWLLRFYPGVRVAVQSKMAEDADALLERLHQSWLKQREIFWHLPWPKWERKVGRIIMPSGSLAMGIPQGAHKLRSYTFSAILSDEMAFQPEAEDAYTAALPTIEGGGKYTAISSAHPSFFQQLVFDNAGSN